MNVEQSIVDKPPDTGWFALDSKQYVPAMFIVMMLLMITGVIYYKDGFVGTSTAHGQIRSDSSFDKAFNLKELEKSVATLNRKAST